MQGQPREAKDARMDSPFVEENTRKIQKETLLYPPSFVTRFSNPMAVKWVYW